MACKKSRTKKATIIKGCLLIRYNLLVIRRMFDYSGDYLVPPRALSENLQ